MNEPPIASSLAPDVEQFDVLCDACGYSLLGITTRKCPECGRKFDPDELPLARVPWLHRKALGTWPAYVRTVKMILLSPAKFVHELSRPVRISPTDAQRFRRITIRIAAVSLALGTAIEACINIPFSSPLVEPAEWLVLFCMTVIAYFSFAVFLRLASDMPVFIWGNLPGMRQYDLAPVQQYACAPLALAPIFAPLALPLGWLWNNWDWAYGPPYIAAIICACLVGLWPILIWAIPVLLMRAATGAKGERLALLTIYLPFHYLTMAVVTFTVLTLVLGGIASLAGVLLKAFL